jgi:hypothetical protein
MTAAMKKLSEKDIYATSLEKFSDKLEVFPTTFTQQLSTIKSDLYACIRNEFQVPFFETIFMTFLINMDGRK